MWLVQLNPLTSFWDVKRTPMYPPLLSSLTYLLLTLLKILNTEIEAHGKAENWDTQAMLDLWRGKVGPALKNVVSHETIDANWVAFSILGMNIIIITIILLSLLHILT